MADEKRGLFGRLFGRRPAGSEPPEPETPPARDEAPRPAEDGGPAPPTAVHADRGSAPVAPTDRGPAHEDESGAPSGDQPTSPDPAASVPAPAATFTAPPATSSGAASPAGGASAGLASGSGPSSAPPAAPTGVETAGEPAGGSSHASEASVPPGGPATGAPSSADSSTTRPTAAAPAAWAPPVPDAGSQPAAPPEATPAAGLGAPSAPSASAPASAPSLFAAPSPPVPAEPEPAPAAGGWLSRLKRGLARTSSALGQNIGGLFTRRRLDTATLGELEDALIEADLGVETAAAITERLAAARYEKGISEEDLRSILAEEVETRLAPVAKPLVIDPANRPHVVLVIGVNGSGKTTTIGKIAARLAREGRSVMLAAGDTFRAAAIEQLKVWGERAGAPVISRPTGADSAGLVFDALKAARAENRDVLLVDTAGRLQNRGELMAELEKVVRVIRKQDPTAPHDVLLVLDATTGQNALQQVEIFRKVAGVTGLAMTKLDGTARGGILVAIAARHKLPVHFVGVGEGIDDLAPFAPRDFARAIAGIGE